VAHLGTVLAAPSSPRHHAMADMAGELHFKTNVSRIAQYVDIN